MRIIINHSSMQPIYEQIVAQIRNRVLDGTLLENTALPSVRNLSTELKISALTVKKAYDALEQEGILTTIHGKGSYISGNSALSMEETRKKEFESSMEKVIRDGLQIGLSKAEIQTVFTMYLEDESC